MGTTPSGAGAGRSHGPWLLGSMLTAVVVGIAVMGWRLHDRARDTTCLANVRQMGIAIRMYAEDNAGLIAPAAYGAGVAMVRWPDLVDPYARSVGAGWHCPRDRRRPGVRAISYGLNARLAGAAEAARPAALHAETEEADVVLLADTDGPESYLAWGSWTSKEEGARQGSWLAPRHKRAIPSGPGAFAAPPRSWGVNLCFVDGHVQWVWDQALSDTARW